MEWVETMSCWTPSEQRETEDKSCRRPMKKRFGTMMIPCGIAFCRDQELHANICIGKEKKSEKLMKWVLAAG